VTLERPMEACPSEVRGVGTVRRGRDRDASTRGVGLPFEGRDRHIALSNNESASNQTQ
jgi:hypothetical protein